MKNDKRKVIKELADNKITQKEAMAKLGLSRQQVYRLLKNIMKKVKETLLMVIKDI